MYGQGEIKLSLDELRPEADFAGSEEGVFASVPAKEMRGLGMEAMMFARSPDFVKQEGAGRFDGAMQIVSDAAFFAAGGGDQGADFGFEQGFLARLSAQHDNQGYGVFRELGGGGWARFAFRCAPQCFALRHGGGIVLQDRADRRARFGLP
jgi:hypothetical protein